MNYCLKLDDTRDIRDGNAMLNTFANYKGTSSPASALRGSADAAALILLNFDSCGKAYKDTWR